MTIENTIVASQDDSPEPKASVNGVTRHVDSLDGTRLI